MSVTYTAYPVISAKNAKSSKTNSTCTRLSRSIKFRAFRCRNFRQQGTCTLTLMRCTTSTHGACFASWESLIQTYTCTFGRYTHIRYDVHACRNTEIHNTSQRIRVFYVIQGAKRRIISLRASKSEALSCTE